MGTIEANPIVWAQVFFGHRPVGSRSERPKFMQRLSSDLKVSMPDAT